jgi:multidrug efflux pump subunit AcrA (membrane-fusion protein)
MIETPQDASPDILVLAPVAAPVRFDTLAGAKTTAVADSLNGALVGAGGRAVSSSTIGGTVSTIGTDALPPDTTYEFTRFPIDLKIARQYVESAGKRYPLQAGMALTADLRLEKRTVLDLFMSSVLRNTDAVRTIR